MIYDNSHRLMDRQIVVLVVGLVMALGLLGTLLPFVPGLPLIWAAALVYGLVDGFTGVDWSAMVVISLLMIGGIISKIVLPQRRASASGAPRSTLIVGAVVGFLGFFTVPVVGLPLGALLGVLLAERRRTNDWSKALHSTTEVAVGFGLGTLVEMGAGIAMIACWIAWALLQAH
jgi:uncharacterized protein